MAGGEDSIVDAFFKILGILEVLAEEDEASARTTKRLVRGSGDYIAVVERAVEDLCSDESRCVCHVAEEPCAFPFGSSLEVSIVPVTGIRRSATNDHSGLENLCL